MLGPISPNSLGITITHEHLLIDFRCVYQTPTGSGEEDLPQLDPKVLDSRMMIESGACAMVMASNRERTSYFLNFRGVL